MITSVGAETARLISVDLATGAEEVLAEDPVADVSGVRLDPRHQGPQIVVVLKDRSEYIVLDPSVADDVAAIRALHPGDPVFSSADRRRRDLAGGLHQRRRAGALTSPTTGRPGPAGSCSSTSPCCRSTRWRLMEPFTYTARDGLTIHGYATFPPDGERSGLPTVLNVHGGPWARDVWGYRPDAQWLANRGYLCVQVNFRGSTGYGKSFVNAGDREWGAKMQDDLTDAVAVRGGAGLGRPEAGRDLRRLLRRLRGAGRRDVHARTCTAARSTSSGRRTSRR